MLATQAGYGAFTAVLNGSTVAMLIYAHDQGGVTEAGTALFVIQAPAAVSAPFVSVAFDRFSPRRALASGYTAQAGALAMVAAAIALGLPALVTYTTMLVVAASQMATRPTISSALPRLVHHPTELSAANSAVGVIGTCGLFAGPAAVSLIFLATDDRAIPFVVGAVTMALAAVISTTIKTLNPTIEDPPRTISVLTDAVDGLRLLIREPQPRHVITLSAVSRFVTGALGVAVVAIATDVLDRGDAATGALTSAIGVGAVVGALLSFGFVGRGRLSAAITLSVLLVAVPTLALGRLTDEALITATLVVVGIGRPLIVVAGRTMLQGLSADDSLARIFGVVEGVSFFAGALGGVAFTSLTSAASLSIALFMIGAVPIALLVLEYPKLRRIDQDRPDVAPELLASVRSVPIFTPLPAFELEEMLLHMGCAEFGPGEVVFEEGDPGNILYVIDDGSAVVELSDRCVETEAANFFGEIALVRDQPRMATVRAGPTGLTAFTLERDVFLDSIRGVYKSHARIQAIVRDRLGEPPPTGPSLP